MLRKGEIGVPLSFQLAGLSGPARASYAFVAAALCSGYEFAGQFPIDDYLDANCADLPEFQEALAKNLPVRHFCVVFKDTKAKFGKEELDIREFQRRYEDSEWHAAHPDHPISYLARSYNWLSKLAPMLVGQKPRIRLHRAGREVFLIQEGDPRYDATQNAQLLEFYRNGWKK